MLYDEEKLFQSIYKIYEYFRVRMKFEPRSLKLHTISHKRVVTRFIQSMPSSAGMDWIYKFLLFQFYVYSSQNQERQPLPVWFLGKAAFDRYNNASDGHLWYSLKWAEDNHFINPIFKHNYMGVSKNDLDEERKRMSLKAGLSYCGVKYKDLPFSFFDDICRKCVSYNDCKILSETVNGKQLFKEVMNSNVINVGSYAKEI